MWQRMEEAGGNSIGGKRKHIGNTLNNKKRKDSLKIQIKSLVSNYFQHVLLLFLTSGNELVSFE